MDDISVQAAATVLAVASALAAVVSAAISWPQSRNARKILQARVITDFSRRDA